MKRNSGIATSTSFCITKKTRWTARSNTMNPRPRKPKVMPSAMSVKAVGKPIRIARTMSAIMASPRASGLNPLDLALLRQDRLGLLDVREARRPHAGPRRDEGADRFGDSLDRHQERGDRDDGLQRVDRRRRGGRERSLMDRPRC